MCLRNRSRRHLQRRQEVDTTSIYVVEGIRRLEGLTQLGRRYPSNPCRDGPRAVRGALHPLVTDSREVRDLPLFVGDPGR